MGRWGIQETGQINQFQTTQQAQQSPLSNNEIFQYRQMMQQLRQSANPQALLQTMIAKNPNLKQAVEFVNQNGGNAEALACQMMKQRGIDPSAVMNLFK